MPLEIAEGNATGDDVSEHLAAVLKVKLRGQFFSTVELLEAHVIVIVNFAVLIVPEFFMNRNWAPFARASVMAPVATPPTVALG